MPLEFKLHDGPASATADALYDHRHDHKLEATPATRNVLTGWLMKCPVENVVQTDVNSWGFAQATLAKATMRYVAHNDDVTAT